jgi:trehalose 6-phosphate synthase
MRQPYPKENSDFLVRRVPLTQQELDGYYYGMANRVLWPVSHYLTQHVELENRFIDMYRTVNRRFADAILEETSGDAPIWVQDYHLMLTPGHLREARPSATIGQFWHIPWPAMEVFRILPWSRELLRGMLGSDLIGFHVPEYVDNFIDSAHVLLDADVTENTVTLDGHTTRVEAHPIGIDVNRFEQMSQAEEVGTMAGQLRERLGTENIVIGIDRLDYTKGILSRLQAFEQFLEENPDLHGSVSFYQIATPSRTEVESYQELKSEVDEVVGRINGRFALDDWVPVNYRYRTYSQFELCAFYRAADAALITPLRDGMNVVTQEFVTASENGALILSELTGAAQYMEDAIHVNPYDQDELAQSIREALDMPEEEKKTRLRSLKATVRKLDVHAWADGFLDSLEQAN